MSRLIDVDVLRKSVLDLPNCYNGFSDAYDKSCIIGVIDEQPTIDERKKGKWMKWEARNGLTNGSECSECGYITSAVPNYGTKFCPNCGARMKGEK